MPNRALITGAKTLIDGLIMDVATSPVGVTHRTHELRTRLGGEPLEDGRQVTDHAVALPKQLKLAVVVSDYLGVDSVVQVQAQLEAMQAAQTTFTVTTEWGTYPEMIISRAEASTQNRGMLLSLEVREILRVPLAGGSGVPASAREGAAADRGALVPRGLVSLAT